MAFIRNASNVDNIRDLADRPTISATSLKTKFDQIGEDLQNYLNTSLLNQLENVTPGTSGAENVGSAAITGLTGTTIHSQLSSIATADTNNVKLTGNQTIDGVKTFSSSPIVPTPTTDYQASTRKFVTDSVMGIVVPTLPTGSVTNEYLGSDVKVGSNALLHDTSPDVVTEVNLKAVNETAWDVAFTKTLGKTTSVTSTLSAVQKKKVDFTYDSNGKVATMVTNEGWRTVTATFNRNADGTVSTITKVVT